MEAGKRIVLAGGPGTSPLEHSSQHRREVGHDAVDAEVEQAVHLVRIVDGPDVHVASEAVRRLDERRRHDLHGAVTDRDLEALVRRRAPVKDGEAGAAPESGDLPRTGGGAETVAEEV